MKTKEIKVAITVRVLKSVVDQSDEPYFYRVGFEKEAEVMKTEVAHGIEAWFEGFEILSNERGEEDPGIDQEEEKYNMVAAKLYYNVLVEVV